ncbi:hypothetical protein EN837_09235 [bacterium M00.F.Ca.ET.194.01.1.1]|nr:hypothetical protein EN837_09235 [bacterium M00.F.Ca.ET.194.01.1.1]TGS56424.1 hypothetical protein EN822_09235 [bacterium M00.F.Ca.ET.179.01.1.1]TGV49326.1 hypothetical protein EN811_09235 [bacterium M00.F.Ca.ET.168.01.1.1]
MVGASRRFSICAAFCHGEARGARLYNHPSQARPCREPPMNGPFSAVSEPFCLNAQHWETETPFAR